MAFSQVGTGALFATQTNPAAPSWDPSQPRNAGDLLVCMVGAINSNPFPPLGFPADWTVAGTIAEQASAYVAVAYKIATGGDAAPQIDIAGIAGAYVHLSEWTGESNPVVDVAATGFWISGTSYPLTGSNPTAANELKLAAWYWTKSGGKAASLTWSLSGLTALAVTSGGGQIRNSLFACGYQLNPPTGSGATATATESGDTPDGVAGTLVTFKAGTPSSTLAIQNAAHAQQADSLTPTQAHNLAIDSARSSQAAPQMSLTQDVVSVAGTEPGPAGDLPGWHQILLEDFDTDVPLGSWPGTYDWQTYAVGWVDPPGTGQADASKVVSVHEGALDYWLHTENGVHLVAVTLPSWTGPTFGRFAARFRVSSPVSGFRIGTFLGPDSGVWPGEGEIDFAESANFTASDVIETFMHWRGGTTGGDQNAYPSTALVADGNWHTAIVEWLPDRCTFFVDGVQVGENTDTSLIPNTPFHLIVQTETSFDGAPADTVQTHVLYDWVAIWSVATDLVIQDARSAQAADNMALGQIHQLVVQDAAHTATADQVGLTAQSDLEVQDAHHAQAADQVGITASSDLAIDSAAHAQTAENVSLSAAGALGIADARSAQHADNLVLGQVHELEIQDAHHAQQADSLGGLTGSTTLAIHDSHHLQVADLVTLAQVHELEVQDSHHAQHADNVVSFFATIRNIWFRDHQPTQLEVTSGGVTQLEVTSVDTAIEVTESGLTQVEVTSGPTVLEVTSVPTVLEVTESGLTQVTDISSGITEAELT